MNNNEVLKNLKTLQVRNYLPNESNISNVDWLSQTANDQSLLFYKFNPGKDKEAALKQVNESLAAITVVNNEDFFEKIEGNKIYIPDENWLPAQKSLLDEFYSYRGKCKLIGVTGTNGKTSCAHLIDQLAVMNGLKSAYCGTLGLIVNGEELENFSLTTPSFIDIRKALHKFEEEIDVFSLELSSHALDQERAYGLRFDAIGWTNLSQDHFDYHGSMEEYFKCKRKITELSESKVYLPRSQKNLLKKLGETAEETTPLSEDILQNTKYSTGFNRDNLELAHNLLSRAVSLNIAIVVNELIGTPGRNQHIYWDNKLIVIDFAHTPDALENICRELKKEYSEKELYVLFGCGGDRDRKKRPLMAQSVERFADKIFLTSDNPRFEDPERIISDTLEGFKGTKNLVTIVDRKKCLRKAMSEMNDDTLLLVAGKGHEPYIDIKGKKIPYSDESEIKKIMG